MMSYPIEFCGNCGVGQKTKEDNPYFCDYYSPEGEKTGRRCVSWTPAHYLHHERVVYICSPMRPHWAGELGRQQIQKNLRRAAAYCRAAVESYAIPICPHLYFSSFLDEINPSDRNVGMEMGIAILKLCDELWVFGEPSEGIKAEIEAAKDYRLVVNYIPQSVVEKLNKEAERSQE